MKKLLVLLMGIVLVIAIAACGNKDTKSAQSTTSPAATTQSWWPTSCIKSLLTSNLTKPNIASKKESLLQLRLIMLKAFMVHPLKNSK